MRAMQKQPPSQLQRLYVHKNIRRRYFPTLEVIIQTTIKLNLQAYKLDLSNQEDPMI